VFFQTAFLAGQNLPMAMSKSASSAGEGVVATSESKSGATIDFVRALKLAGYSEKQSGKLTTTHSSGSPAKNLNPQSADPQSTTGAPQIGSAESATLFHSEWPLTSTTKDTPSLLENSPGIPQQLHPAEKKKDAQDPLLVPPLFAETIVSAIVPAAGTGPELSSALSGIDQKIRVAASTASAATAIESQSLVGTVMPEINHEANATADVGSGAQAPALETNSNTISSGTDAPLPAGVQSETQISQMQESVGSQAASPVQSALPAKGVIDSAVAAESGPSSESQDFFTSPIVPRVLHHANGQGVNAKLTGSSNRTRVSIGQLLGARQPSLPMSLDRNAEAGTLSLPGNPNSASRPSEQRLTQPQGIPASPIQTPDVAVQGDSALPSRMSFSRISAAAPMIDPAHKTMPTSAESSTESSPDLTITTSGQVASGHMEIAKSAAYEQALTDNIAEIAARRAAEHGESGHRAMLGDMGSGRVGETSVTAVSLPQPAVNAVPHLVSEVQRTDLSGITDSGIAQAVPVRSRSSSVEPLTGLMASDHPDSMGALMSVSGLSTGPAMGEQPTILPQRTIDQIVSSTMIESSLVEREGSQQFQIRLDPPELGGLSMEIHRASDGRVSVHVSAVSAETHALLERHSREISQALHDQGLPVSQFDLSHQQQHGSSKETLHYQEQFEQSRLMKEARLMKETQGPRQIDREISATTSSDRFSFRA